MQDWSSFKPVAHLWAAYAAFTDFAQNAHGEFISGLSDKLIENSQSFSRDDAEQIVIRTLSDDNWVDLFDFVREDNFPIFLSLAETFRIKAEAQKVRGARNHLLPPGTAFVAP